MSPRSSYSGSDNGPPSENSIKREVELISDVVDEDRLQKKTNQQHIIVVVRVESVPDMELKLKKPAWHKILTGEF